MKYVARAADWLKKGVFPISRVSNVIGTFALVAMVLITVTEIISRRAFGAPIVGATELTLLFFVLVIFLMLANCAIEDGHIIVTLFTQRFPKRVQLINAAVMHIITVGILSITSWQLVVYGMRVQSMGQTASIIPVPTYPFVYLAVLAFILLTLVYLIKFLYSMVEVRQLWN